MAMKRKKGFKKSTICKIINLESVALKKADSKCDTLYRFSFKTWQVIKVLFQKLTQKMSKSNPNIHMLFHVFTGLLFLLLTKKKQHNLLYGAEVKDFASFVIKYHISNR